MSPLPFSSPRIIISALSHESRCARAAVDHVSSGPSTTTEGYKSEIPRTLTARATQTATSLPPIQASSSALSPVEVGAIFVGTFFAFLLLVTLVLLYLQHRHGRQYFSTSFFRLGQVSSKGSGVESVHAPPADITTATTSPQMSHHADDLTSLRGFGRHGYNPVESHLRLQRDDPTMVPKVGGLTRFIVGERLAHNFAIKAAGPPPSSTLSDSHKSASIPPRHSVMTYADNPSIPKKGNKLGRFKISIPAWTTLHPSAQRQTNTEVLQP